MKKISLFILSFCMFVPLLNAQILVSSPTDINQMVNNFILTGVTASNVLFTGDSNAVGSFTNGNTTNLGMSDGIILTTGAINGSPGIGDSALYFTNISNSTPGDALLTSIIQTAPTFDAAVLEFDLVPVGTLLEFKYVFASEEYPEFVGSSFNDIFGFFINGPNPEGGNYVNNNIAIIPGTNSVVCINNVNATTNSTYFIDNLGSNGGSIVFDGFTTVLTAQVNVIPSSTYHLKMAIADVADNVFDSGIFLKAQSMKSYTPTVVLENKTPHFDVFPNPITSASELKLNLLQSSKVKISIRDISGKLVFSSLKENMGRGVQSISLQEFNTNNAAGLYMIQIETNQFSEVQKLIKY